VLFAQARHALVVGEHARDQYDAYLANRRPLSVVWIEALPSWEEQVPADLPSVIDVFG